MHFSMKRRLWSDPAPRGLGAVERLPAFSQLYRQLLFGPTVCHCAFVQLGQHHCHNDRIGASTQGQERQNFPLVAAATPPPKETA
jgi:hypothetical protein